MLLTESQEGSEDTDDLHCNEWTGLESRPNGEQRGDDRTCRPSLNIDIQTVCRNKKWEGEARGCLVRERKLSLSLFDCPSRLE